MQVEKYHSDDYAGLVSGSLQFYYGYEYVDPSTEEWCFVVKKNGEEIFRKTTKEIENAIDDRQLDSPQDFLIAGIGIWLLVK